jgi:PEP-CTERM motif
LQHVNAPETQVNEIKASAFGIQIARSRVAAINSQAHAVWAPRSHLIFLIKSGSMYTNATHGEFMKKVSLALLALASAFAIAPAALADSWNFTFSDSNGVTASGTITASLISPGEWGITGGTITIDATGGGISGSGIILADPNGAGNEWTWENPANSGGANYTADNVFFPGGDPQLDGDGFNFELTSYIGPDGGIPGNIWGNGADNYTMLEGAYDIYDSGAIFNATPAPTPEPGSLFLLGTGLLGLAVVGFRKAGASGLI